MSRTIKDYSKPTAQRAAAKNKASGRKENFPASALLCGIMTAISITALVFVICAAIMTYGNGLSDTAVNTIVYITSLVSVLAGSIPAAAKLNKRGLINGMVVGVVYTAIMVLIGYLTVPDFSLGTKTFITLAIAVLSGAAGGVAGVNMF